MTADNPFESSNPADWPVRPSTLLELAPNGWLLVDREGRILLINAQVESLFGYVRDELIGSPVEMLVPERLRGEHLLHRSAYNREPTMRPMGLGMTLLARRKHGEEFPVEISLSPVEAGGDPYVIAVIRDISERVLLEEQRNHFQVELEMERERDRIGMDLHDGIMQEIYAAGLSLELAVADIEERPSEATTQVEHTIESLHEIIRHIRSYIFDLRPRQYGGSLGSALSELAREFEQNTQIDVNEDLSESLPRVADDQANAVYLIVHEAMSNVRKHAQASSLQLSARVVPSALVVEVQDDGAGFDLSEDMPQVHRGLRNMMARARTAGASLDISSAPGQGTVVRIELPLAEDSARGL